MLLRKNDVYMSVRWSNVFVVKTSACGSFVPTRSPNTSSWSLLTAELLCVVICSSFTSKYFWVNNPQIMPVNTRRSVLDLKMQWNVSVLSNESACDKHSRTFRPIMIILQWCAIKLVKQKAPLEKGWQLLHFNMALGLMCGKVCSQYNGWTEPGGSSHRYRHLASVSVAWSD